MGIWSSFKEALGLVHDPLQRAAAPVALSEAGVARLEALPGDDGIRLSLMPVPAGWMVQVHEGPLTDEPHPGFEDLHVQCTEEAFQRLQGLVLDHGDGRWRVTAEVSVRAKETPNPDGRLFVTDRRLSSGRIYATAETTGAPYLASRLLARPDVATVLIRDASLTIERVPHQPWDAIDRAVATAIREHVLSAGGVLTPAARPEDDDELRAAVWEILEHRVLPTLHRDGGDLELVDVADGIVTVHLVGACRSCPASTLTLKHGIERTLLDAFPGEIDEVQAV